MNSIPFFNYTHERSIPFRACDFFDELVARFASNPDEFDGKSNQLFSRPHIQELAEELLNMVSVHMKRMVCIVENLYYRRSGFNCEYLLIANCKFFYVLQLIDLQT